MKVSKSIQNLTKIACIRCGSIINQVSGKRRTICPYCGNFIANDCQRDESIRSRSVTSIVIPKPNLQKDKEVKSRFSWLRFKSKTSATRGRDRLKLPYSVDSLPSLSPNSRMNITGRLSPKTPPCCDKILSLDSLNDTKDKTIKPITLDSLRDIMQEKRSNSEWNELKDIMTDLIGTFRSTYFHFHKKQKHNEIDIELVDLVYDCFLDMPIKYQGILIETIQKSLNNCEFKYFDEEILALVVLIMNPLFERQNFYSTFVSLLAMIISIHQRSEQQKIIITLVKLPTEKFRQILERVQNLLTFCLLSNKASDDGKKDKILENWKQKSVQFITFLNAANNFCPVSRKLSHFEFYNCSIDQMNLGRDYDIWQSSTEADHFSFCQYPCVLSINAKKQIIQKESEQQMVTSAKKTLVSRIQQRELPDFDMVFLNLSIRRKNLVSDSMSEILSKRNELKKKLKVTFVGEPGLDMGGLTKEWFLLLLRQILHAKVSVFTNDEKSRVNWFRPISSQNYKEFYLTGVLMGLAVYNSINLDVKFPLICYKKLLSPPVCVVGVKDPGICKVTLNDLKSVYPELAKGLFELLQYEGDVEQDICATYEIMYEDNNGISIRHCLKQDGASIPVTNDNRKEYVNLYCEFLLNKVIQSEFCAFYHGFHTVCDSNAFMLLKAEEVENLVCGNPLVNLIDLKKIVEYDGYNSTDPTIIFFWEVILEFSENLQKLFLHFATGSDRVPVGGVQEMQFKISKASNKTMLPMAFTCFNQLILPSYSTKNNLKLKLLIAMENSEGFGLQ